jgi:hypothetical protein
MARDLHVGLVDVPAVANRVPAGPGGLGEQRREPLHPAVECDVIDLDASLGEQLLDVAIGQAEAQVPADRQDDHVRWEAEAGECRPGDGCGAGRRVLMAAVCLLECVHSRCNSAASMTTIPPYPGIRIMPATNPNAS